MVENCVECLLSDKHWKTLATPLLPVPLPENSWDKVGLDFFCPFEVLPSENRYLILLVDYYTKWIYYTFCNSPSTDCAIKFLDTIFNIEGFPKVIITDNGTHFVSQKICSFLKAHDISHFRVALYSPASNGLVERGNKIIKRESRPQFLPGTTR